MHLDGSLGIYLLLPRMTGLAPQPSQTGRSPFRDSPSFLLCSILPPMPRDGAMILSDVRQPTLELICEQCGRSGRYSVARLLAKHGDAKLPELAAQIADCPEATTASIYDRCKDRWAAWQ